MDEAYMELLEKLRDKVGVLRPTNGYRCPIKNKAVGGHPNSNHMKGRAIDCYGTYIGLERLAREARKYFNEVILYSDKGMVHIGLD